MTAARPERVRRMRFETKRRTERFAVLVYK